MNETCFAWFGDPFVTRLTHPPSPLSPLSQLAPFGAEFFRPVGSRVKIIPLLSALLIRQEHAHGKARLGWNFGQIGLIEAVRNFPVSWFKGGYEQSDLGLFILEVEIWVYLWSTRSGFHGLTGRG